MSFLSVLLETPMGQRVIAREAEKAAAKATAEATVKAKRAATIEHILTLLHQRFGNVPKAVSAQLRNVGNQKKPEGLFKLVLDCTDLEAFRKAIGKS